MNRRPRSAFSSSIAAVSMTLICTAPARAATGPYVGFQGGASLLSGAQVGATIDGTAGSGRQKFKDGPVGGIVAGYGFENGLQPEVEVNYQRNTPRGGSGDIRAGSATGNLYYNFSQKGYYFYLGGGAGYATLHAHFDGGSNDTDDRPVYQGGAGIGLSATRNLLVGVDYRYRGTFEKATFSYEFDGAPANASFAYRGSSVLFGLRWSFGTDYGATARTQREPVNVVPVEPN